MKQHQFFDINLNLDSFFFSSNHPNYNYKKFVSIIHDYVIRFKVDRFMEPVKHSHFESFNFKGVLQADFLKTSTYSTYVWKKEHIDFPTTVSQCEEAIKCNNIDAFIYYDHLTGDVHWGCSLLSKVHLFFRVIDGYLMIYNDLDLMHYDDKLSQPATEIFSSYGWLPPEMSPYENVEVSSFDKVYHYSSKNKVIHQKNVKSYLDSFNSNYSTNLLSPETEFYKLMEDAVEQVTGNFFTMTGGCDTRLIFSCIKDKNKNIYWADSSLRRKDIYFDRCIVENILGDFKLKGFVLDKKSKERYCAINLKDNELSTVRSQYSLFHKSVSGMYGGEFVGAGYLDQVKGSKTLVGTELTPQQIEVLEKYPDLLDIYFKNSSGPVQQVMFMRLFFKTTLSEFYFPHNVWQKPYKHARTQTQKPFLDHKLIKFMAHMDPKVVRSHSFYRNIFIKLLPELSKYPIQNLMMTEYLDFKKPEDIYELPDEFDSVKVKENNIERARARVIEDSNIPFLTN